MKDKVKTKEQLIAELAEMRQRVDGLKTGETGRKRAKDVIQGSRIWLPAAGMLVLLCTAIWFDEILDLPHLLLGAPRTPMNWQEAIVETGLVLAVGLFTVLRLVHDVTEQVRAAEALRASEEYTRNIIESSLDMIITCDMERHIVEFNKAAQETFGYRQEEVVGEHVDVLYADPQESLLVYQTTIREEKCAREILDRRKSGEVFPAFLSASVLRDASGEIVGVMGVARDITERRCAEEALARRNSELALLNHAGQALSSTLDLDQILVTVLEEVRRLLGVVASSIWLTDPETDELVCWQATGPQNGIVRGWRLAPGEGIAGWVVRSGESLIVPDTQADERHFKEVDRQTGLPLRSILSVPLRFKGNVTGALQMVDTEVGRFQPADLTLVESLAANAAIAIENAQLYQDLREHAEQLEQRVQERTAELEAQYARLDAILGSTTDGIVVTNAEGSIVQANPVAQAWLTQTLSPEEAGRLREAVQSVARQACAEETRLRPEAQPEGFSEKNLVSLLELTGLDLELSAAPISPPSSSPRLREERQGKEAAAVVDIHDVTHLKALDRMKTRFTANISHELRTPITTIKLYAHLMQQQPEKCEQYLDVLAQEADRQARLVGGILEISRIDAGRLEMKPCLTVLDELVEATVVSHQVLAQERGLTLEHRPALLLSPPANGGGWGGAVSLVDPERMMQVLNNLVGNAIRYTPEGGKVVVSTGTEEAEDRTWATVTVADTGMGIPEEDLPHVFDRFFRGEEPRAMQLTGTGLGLAIVKEIVELHGGRVTVESPSTTLRAGEKGVGSTFTVWLPLAN